MPNPLETRRIVAGAARQDRHDQPTSDPLRNGWRSGRQRRATTGRSHGPFKGHEKLM
jgi:hypothetical protein